MMVAGEASFDGLLRDKLAELDADERDLALSAADQQVERLRLDARQTVIAQEGRPLARPGHQAYLSLPDIPAEPGHRPIDVRY